MMLGPWINILPLFIVKWLARRYCEQWLFTLNGVHLKYAMAQVDVLVKLKNGT